MFKVYLDIIKQIFVKLKKEGFSGEIVFRVSFNQGGVRGMKTLKQKEMTLDSD